MNRSINIIFVLLLIGVVALIVIAARTSIKSEVLTMGFGALVGLSSIAFTQALSARAALEKSSKERLQDARGLARALAAEIHIFGNVALAKGFSLNLHTGQYNEAMPKDGIDPDDLLRFIELPSRAVFDANTDKIALLEVIEEFGKFREGEERLVERVVGFYEAIMDLRSNISSAKLQKRGLKAEEVQKVEDSLKASANFAFELSKRLHEFIELSKA